MPMNIEIQNAWFNIGIVIIVYCMLLCAIFCLLFYLDETDDNDDFYA